MSRVHHHADDEQREAGVDDREQQRVDDRDRWMRGELGGGSRR